ncbi:hypothetical protein ILUMI_23463 [Ignelater luminosus]|uniref:RING-type domain-containing protein n=1 Tax=Ignelater luminosus TaxID=2038154 RepID=A0A8K0CFA8_IGNLU|nr:hypothetical protein ILUMI_23463 [Ignelater luminosus]
MDEDSSDTTSSVEHVLMNYKKKMKEDFISNSLSIESPLNSNINININMPSTSENVELSVGIQSGATTKSRRQNVKKKINKTDSLVSINVENNNETNHNKKRNKQSSKTVGNKPSKRLKNNENNQNTEDPDYKPSARRNYSRLSSKALNSIAKRVRIFHETGVVVSDDEDVIACKNKYKKGDKKNPPRQQAEQVPGTTFGQGRVGTIIGGYGVRRWGCCNLSKNNNNNPLLNYCSAHSTINLSQEILNSIKCREERLLQLQQQELLRHPELANIGEDDDDDDDEQYIETPELSKDKRAWVQKFIDSMSADRVDYDKPLQANFVEAVEQKRPSIVVPKQDDLVSSIDNKTIVERIDFKKRQSEGRQRTIDEWLNGCSSTSKSQNNLPIATSTPRHVVGTNLNETCISSIPGPSNVNANAVADTGLINNIEDDRKQISSGVKANIFKDMISSVPATNIEEPFDDVASIDISQLDRSNITLRTPCSKSISYRNSLLTVKPIFEVNDDIMDFVDNLLSQETETINQEVNERCEKWLEDNRRNQDLLQNALDSVIMINDDDIPHMHNDSVEIISDSPEDVIPIDSVNNSVVVVEDDDGVIPIISINNSTNPSTSRSIQGRRKLARRKGPRRKQAHPPPPVQPSALPKPIKPVLSAEERVVRPENKGLRDCPICLENMENKEISATVCGHIFCTSCITAAVRSNRSCPNCRAALTLKKIHPLFI